MIIAVHISSFEHTPLLRLVRVAAQTSEETEHSIGEASASLFEDLQRERERGDGVVSHNYCGIYSNSDRLRSTVQCIAKTVNLYQ